MSSSTSDRPRSASWRPRLAAIQDWLESALPLSVLQLLMRIAVGAVFFRSGLLKLESWDLALLLFRDEYKLPLLPPDIAAVLGTAVEIGAPLLLFAGLLTRLATLPLLAMTLVIEIFVYPDAWNEHLMWAVPLLFLLTRGPGALSLDRVLGIEPARASSAETQSREIPSRRG
jgi:putative oxidoreductase